MDLNNCCFTGRLTKDAEKRTLPTGKTVVTTDLACNTGYGDYAKTLFVNVQIWGKTGDTLLQYLTKAKQIAVSGELEEQKWTGKADGKEYHKLVLNCTNNVILLGGGERSTAGQGQGQEPAAEGDVAF